MKIELLLQHVSQDQRNPDGQIAFGGWMHGPSSGGSGGGDQRKKDEKDKTKPHKDEKKTPPKVPSKPKALSKFVLRQEDWGGILICTRTQKVFGLDDEAFGVLTRLNETDGLERWFTDESQITAESLEQLLILHGPNETATL